ncbi:bifunctional aconitate hydratase 2/2-methylisocitrate dehydratase [Cupriavidus oxalaticus]|uniref:bifunctional aconitate hydratase 2/2-methylisocitrate dehydratase n=1 Tax=Cupriavidus oxalaticus TaxID=96344 RepID=UPI0040345A1C
METYLRHRSERAAQGLPPYAMNRQQVLELITTLRQGTAIVSADEAVELLTSQVPAGVDPAAQAKAEFLAAVARGELRLDFLSARKAASLLGTMLGGFNVDPLVSLLDDRDVGDVAAAALSGTILVFNHFDRVVTKAESGSAMAQQVLTAWANAEWFTARAPVPDNLDVVVFRVEGEITTDDLSPATEVWSRPDVPLHALSMLRNARPGVVPDEEGRRGPLAQLESLRQTGRQIAFVGDVVGTGSSRKSATNSLLWHVGVDVPFQPNKKVGGVCLGASFAPIFFNTLQDAGCLPIEVDVAGLQTGDLLTIRPCAGQIIGPGAAARAFELKGPLLLDEVRAGGRINLILGRRLTAKARQYLGLPDDTVFRQRPRQATPAYGFTLAQKIVGRACGLPTGQGVRPGGYCEPRISTVGSPDTTGPLTREELKDLACLEFSADLVLQSFCHTVAYPKPADIRVQRELPGFITARSGVSLRPGDGIIHSWLNRLAVPDTVGTGGDSHTRLPVGISFPAGSGLVAFAAATGAMPLDMPESVLVRFRGAPREGVTIRDLVHAIPLFARRQGLLTLEKATKRNVFAGRILEIEGLADLTVEQAFEFTDASAERSAAACAIQLSIPAVSVYLKDNVALIRRMIDAGYSDRATLERRLSAMEVWLDSPMLLQADADAQYAAVIEIDLQEIGEPILCCPNDPDDARFLSEVAGTHVDEVFLGSCMTNITHFQAASELLDGDEPAPARLWVAPPTRMDADQLREEGRFASFVKAGARIETPGCSLCMGNQARVRDGATVVSTSTRNFPNRMGDGAKVFLASAQVAAIASRLGRLPDPAEYMAAMGVVKAAAGLV